MQSVGNGNRAVVYDGKIAGLYDLEETLGSGHFAVVKLARHVFTGEKVAVKVIDKTKLDEVSRAHLFQEVRCMKLVQHPNVVRLYEVIDTQTKLYLILELGDGGDLYDYIMKHEGGLSESLAREYFRQIVRAISYCHQLHVVHRDLKPENVVFFEKLGVVKLTDFGFSNKFCPGQKLETSCGSLAYSAPEILLGDSYDAPAVDVWSLGVILYMLVCGQPPFEKANDSETLTMIMDCKYTMPAHVSVGCRNLIAAMLVRAPEKRASLQEIAQDPWLIQGAQQDIVPEYLPLVSRQQVSDDDHTLIIQKMVNGNIATKEEILDALDRNEYNHITATYFLLAERKLRQHRQDQIQKRRPELSLPVSSTSRLSPRTRVQATNRDSQATNDSRNHLLVPTSSQLNTPRTPGAESTAGGRSRKCSIVQEEDDEDEIPGGNRDDLTTPLNRRGSRSEGRINIAVQDRVNESERLKKETNPTPNLQTKGLEDICGVKIVNKDTNNVRARLGAGGGLSRTNFENKMRERSNKHIDMGQQRSCSVEHQTPANSCDITSTKVLVDSSTITIPLNSTQPTNLTHTIPKYKTMPSPTRPTAILPGTRALNEIFEEGTDIGSSDSATTTPRPAIRNLNFISNRNSSNNPTTTTQRRSKFHKTRTPSCSSSDASDDDSESRKKRAHKINDVSKPLQPQRRDSHDDSSDSQDQGNATASGGNTSCSTLLLCSTNVRTNNSNQDQDRSGSTTQNTNTTNNTHGRQKTDQPIAFRRHRAGRRRAGETRLRESQSLNRITEVQESELPVMSSNLCNSNNIATMNNNIPAVVNKPKGFSARLFHGFIRKSEVIQSPLSDSVTITTADSPLPPSSTNDDVDMVLGVEFTKTLRVTESSKSSSATKKLKMLGRYFQVHKKICIPLPGLFQRGRLYKAQSCGSIVRDKINTNVHSNPPPSNTRHSVLFTEKGKILRNCLGARFLGNSDGDINQNNGKNKLVFTMPQPPTSKKSTSPLHKLSDVPLCSSKC